MRTPACFGAPRRVIAALFAAAIAWTFPGTGVAALDLLRVPALVSPKAAKSMLLGVAHAGDRLVAVGERGIVLYSDDGGKRWTQAKVPVSVTLTAVDFPSKERGWAVGHDGVVLNTTDGGRTWIVQLDGSRASALVIADLESRVKAVESAVQSASAKSRESAEAELDAARNALEDVKAGVEFGPARPFLGVWFRNDSEGLVVGSFGQLFHTADGGKTWESWGGRIANPEGLHFNAIARMPDASLVISGEAGKLRRSRDGGTTWQTLDTGYAGHLYGTLAVPETKTLVSYGFAGNVFRSEDDGRTWQAVPRLTRKPLIGGLRLADGRLLLLDRDRRQLVSRDDGKSFVLAGSETGRPVASALPVLANGSLVAVGFGGVSLLRPAVSGD